MKHILCFGDSNTHGSNPRGGRWDYNERWTGVLQNLLGNEYRIIEEGCGARTSVITDDLERSDVGINSLPVALHSHSPLDLVIIMLGTNDMKHRFNLLPVDIAVASGKLVKLVKDYNYGSHKTPEVIMISPIEIGEGIEKSVDNTGFSKQSVEISRSLAPHYETYAKYFGAHFFNAAKYAKPSQYDLLHMEKEDHLALATALAPFIKEIIG